MDREKFIACVETEQKRLRLFLLGLCGDPEVADDLAQEALMKAYLASSAFIPRFRFSTWLLKIAHNCYLDYIKLYHARCREPLEPAASMPDAGSSSDGAFRYQRLYQALDLLNEKERSAVMLFYIYGFSVREISGITGESASAVKKQLQRAREHLQTILEYEE